MLQGNQGNRAVGSSLPQYPIDERVNRYPSSREDRLRILSLRVHTFPEGAKSARFMAKENGRAPSVDGIRLAYQGQPTPARRPCGTRR